MLNLIKFLNSKSVFVAFNIILSCVKKKFSIEFFINDDGFQEYVNGRIVHPSKLAKLFVEYTDLIFKFELRIREGVLYFSCDGEIQYIDDELLDAYKFYLARSEHVSRYSDWLVPKKEITTLINHLDINYTNEMIMSQPDRSLRSVFVKSTSIDGFKISRGYRYSNFCKKIRMFQKDRKEGKRLQVLSCIKRKNEPKYYLRNKFFRSNMIAIGGGNLNKLDQCKEFIRLGGSKIDQLRYLFSYVNTQKNFKYLVRFGEYIDVYDIQRIIFNENNPKFKLMSLNLIFSTIKINGDANPGYLLKSFGFKKKKECLHYMVGIYSLIYSLWTADPNAFIPEIHWTTASRPKLISQEKALKKLKNNEPIGRVISLPDGIEQFISHPIWYLLVERIKFYNKVHLFNKTQIRLGLARPTVSWKRLRDYAQLNYKYIYTGDWSQFDKRISSSLWIRALKAIKGLFDNDDEPTRNYVNNWYKFIKKNVVNSNYVVENEIIFSRVGGVPSGSILTSLIDSIVNAIAITDTLLFMGYRKEEFEVGTYGDDHYILLKKVSEPRYVRGVPEKKRIKNFKFRFSETIGKCFGFKMDINQCVLVRVDDMCVEYERPIYNASPDVIKRGTRDLNPVRLQRSKEPFYSYDNDKGESHRWYYVFKNKPSFLSYYWRHDGMAIRPLIECESRMLNPERKILDINTHEGMLWSWMFDNIHHEAFVNDCQHFLLDTFYIKKDLVSKGLSLDDALLLYKDSPYYQSVMYPEEANYNVRMSFRRNGSSIEDLRKKGNKFLKEFFNRFDAMYKKLKKNYTKLLSQDEIYNVRHRMESEVKYYEYYKNKNFFFESSKGVEYKKKNLLDEYSNKSLDRDRNNYIYIEDILPFDISEESGGKGIYYLSDEIPGDLSSSVLENDPTINGILRLFFSDPKVTFRDLVIDSDLIRDSEKRRKIFYNDLKNDFLNRMRIKSLFFFFCLYDISDQCLYKKKKTILEYRRLCDKFSLSVRSYNDFSKKFFFVSEKIFNNKYFLKVYVDMNDQLDGFHLVEETFSFEIDKEFKYLITKSTRKKNL